ncbi:GCN5-related N-acetyltransferase [Laetiporus sulphureus 93-53]|uniref:GCN5-related N-acetyltransferase n=1 Tax=Laetiporus sulphureus 93-53 TaxID=1314785 RepID=A0A165HV86_9APHY|nr:GCN5-related N-acetyltransferase [Laetiporus sulphureus 93-53]KZT12233.1 GCN5-related N-acetyltransferase [Laetiporus sulphureus 93-53]
MDGVLICRVSEDETVSLRHSVLWPNHPVSHVLLPEDSNGFHYGAFLPSHSLPVAVISLFKDNLSVSDHLNGDERRTVLAARFRKFACDPSHRNRGIGTKLLQHAFAMARSEMDCDVIWCDARVSTAEWYERRGMARFGEVFYKEDIPYIRRKATLYDNARQL